VEKSVFPVNMVVHAHITPGGWTTGPMVAAVQRRSLTPSTRTSSRGLGCGMDSTGWGYDPVAGSCEHGNKHSGPQTGYILTSYATTSFSIRTVPHGVPLTVASRCSNLTFIVLMETVRTSETSVYLNETTRSYIPERCLSSSNQTCDL
jgi:hypothetical protein